ncbi:major facilitator superfamily domain-containing protein [Truncatella angustata]|uniref:Major facilitator superfamily domain-containing protein n=1 Tax=Truncatella angustata TaxID=152316 RepID=A0A9P8UII9_9PEZI|nr:major facilitator superfamily domain-containing protein [Truncatella angustata]KAH6652739.1 major facilitator superfamily domain-containing protein [Truncatella angustata]
MILTKYQRALGAYQSKSSNPSHITSVAYNETNPTAKPEPKPENELGAQPTPPVVATGGGTASDPNEIGWNDLDDPNNPRNWSVRKRAYTIGVVMAVLMTTSTASSAIAPAVPQVLADFHTDDTFSGTLIVSIELLAFGFGPLIFAPLSEVYGRRIIYCLANFGFSVVTVGCALSPNLQFLIGFRFLQGLAASCATSHGGGTIGDLVPTHHRGAVTSVYTGALLFGPTLGPIFGGYLADAHGWRWVFWLLVIMNGSVALLYAVTCRETYAPILLARKAIRIREETGNQELYAQGQQNKLPLGRLLRRSIVRPTRMLLFSPIVTGLSLYIATVYGLVYLLFSTFSFVFDDQYHIPESNRGVVYLGLAIGMLISLIISGVVCDSIYKRLTKKHGKEKPEYRLESMIWGAIATPVGLLIYGWTTQYLVHPAVPIFATGFVGFGVTFTYIPIQVYLIDAYTKYSASATAAASVIRAIAGALLPLAGLPMYDRLGLGWGNSLLAFLAIGLAILPLYFVRVGERWRQRFSVEFD